MSSWCALLVLGLFALSSAADIQKIRAATEEVENAERVVLDAVGAEPDTREAVPRVQGTEERLSKVENAIQELQQDMQGIAEDNKEIREELSALTAVPAPGCPDTDFVRFDFIPDYCFLFVETPMSWYDANTYCRLRNAKLADVGNFNEHTVLTTYTKNFADLVYMPGSSHPGYWLAVNDIYKEDDWVSSNTHKHTGFTVWQKGYPRKGNNQQDCVEMYKTWEYRWYDQVCTSLNGAICRADYDYGKDSKEQE